MSEYKNLTDAQILGQTLFDSAAPDAEELARIKDAIKQRDAIFALEGFKPTDQIRAIDAAVLAGRVTRSQVAKEIVEYAKQHKTTDGFIQTRAWA